MKIKIGGKDMRIIDMKGIYLVLLVLFDKEGNINEKGLR